MKLVCAEAGDEVEDDASGMTGGFGEDELWIGVRLLAETLAGRREKERKGFYFLGLHRCFRERERQSV